MNSLINRPFSLVYRSIYTTSRYFCKPEVPRNVYEEFQSAHNQEKPGAVYDKKPFRMSLKQGQKYSWCFCGKSKTQPLCDGTHKVNSTGCKFF
ncbi:hypothetical protein ACKWTF_007139 [Chironomus riparius]